MMEEGSGHYGVAFKDIPLFFIFLKILLLVTQFLFALFLSYHFRKKCDLSMNYYRWAIHTNGNNVIDGMILFVANKVTSRNFPSITRLTEGKVDVTNGK